MNQIFLGAISLIIGYGLGSISISYFLGRWLRGIDIREHGTKKTGTTNTYLVLGLWPAVATGIYDLSKGLVAMAIAHYLLGAPEIFVYSAGVLAIVGHIFPFYLKFKGGQGVATALGLLFYFLFIFVTKQWFTWLGLFILAGLSLIFLFVSRRTGSIIGLAIIPSFLVFLYLDAPLNLQSIFLGIILLFILYINIFNIKKDHLIQIPKEKIPDVSSWRTILRPLAVIFPLLYFVIEKRTLLVLVGGVALFFIIVDIVRLISRKINVLLIKAIFIKPKELKVFSSMSFFLMASFITILIFNKEIAILALTFLIFGDLFSKIFGSAFGKIKFFKKSLEGSLTYFATCLVIGYIFIHFISLPFWVILVGGLAAAITEVLPIGIDDNFTVALISSAVMEVTKVF